MPPWLRRLLALLRGSGGGGTGSPGGGRVRGDPPSGNGASSFHLSWDLPGEFAAVSVTLEVLEPPSVDRLYFWALQATFTDRGRDGGAAHLGLQWHPSYPGRTAVNWGGYRPTGSVLAGSESLLPSSAGNPHTRDYRWSAGRPYRLRIARSPETLTAWRGSVTDLRSGRETVVRDLDAQGTHLRGVVMWSEVFARCEHPSVAVRWSAPEAVTDGGEVVRPTAVVVNYQSHGDGGCANTNSVADEVGLVQRTNCDRATPLGARLAVPSPRPGLGTPTG
jgi:hypothetical protein